MALYARIIGRDDNGDRVENRIAPEVLTTCISEFARGALTGSKVLELLVALGCPLDAAEIAQAQALLATIAGTSTPIAKLSRYIEIRDVLFLARLQAPGYSRPREVKARLGV